MKASEQGPFKMRCLGVAIVSLCLVAGLGIIPAASAADTIYPTYDTYVYSYYPTTNYDSAASISMANMTVAGNARYSISYIKFDTSAYSALNVQDAELCLTPSGASTSGSPLANQNMTWGIFTVLSDWDSNLITWNNQPCSTGFNASCNSTAEYSGSQSFSFLGACYNLTAATVRSLATGSLRITLFPTARNDTGFSQGWYAKDWGILNQIPQLVITYEGTVTNATTTTTPTLYDPVFNVTGYFGIEENSGLGNIIDMAVTPLLWAVLGALIGSGALAIWVGDNTAQGKALVFVASLLTIFTIFSILGIFPWWFLVIEVIVGAVIFAKGMVGTFNTGGG